MAIKNRKYPIRKLVNDSDIGFRYCNSKHAIFAEENGNTMSMTKQYDPYENIMTEDLNTDLAQKMTPQAISIYNNLRPHLSLTSRTTVKGPVNPIRNTEALEKIM